MKIQRTCRTLLFFLVLMGVFLLSPIPRPAYPNEVAGVCGVYPADEGAYIAVVIEHGDGEALAELEWFNNDGQQPFEGLVLVEGLLEEAPDLSGGALVLGEVWGLSSDWSQVLLEQPVVSSTGLIHAVFIIPEGGIRTGEGAFGGPGIGYETDGSGLRSYFSADGLAWARMHEDFGLAVQPGLVAASSKNAPLQLSKLDGFDGAPAASVLAPEDRPEAPKTAFLRARPNPFNPRTEIRYSLERAGRARIVVYDVRGRRIQTLVDERLKAGLHSVIWHGNDTRGSSVASGVYYLKMVFAEKTLTQAITLVR